jgi:uncharacterized protein
MKLQGWSLLRNASNIHMEHMDKTPFHVGEQSAQALAGFASPPAVIRDWMPDQHRAFFSLLRFLPIATVDTEGAPVATILTGPPGFITSPDRNTLHLDARPDPEDPAAAFFAPYAPIGILGIDLATRRRNRANGRLRAVDSGGMTVSVTQSFGNCPQYIQTRFSWDAAPEAGRVEALDGLDPAAREMITSADTFFVASSSGDRAGALGGVDLSHRGGRPGFVAVAGNTLVIPDFHGNRYFNTFGNLLLDPRVALLFVDWTSGMVLHVFGRAEIMWEANAQAFAGAERLWQVYVTRALRRPSAIPLRWSFGHFAPQTLQTGTWSGSDVA